MPREQRVEPAIRRSRLETDDAFAVVHAEAGAPESAPTGELVGGFEHDVAEGEAVVTYSGLGEDQTLRVTFE